MSIFSELQQVNEDCLCADNSLGTREEVEEILVLVRLDLYNRNLPCGPEAIRKGLDELYLGRSLPSRSTSGG